MSKAPKKESKEAKETKTVSPPFCEYHVAAGTRCSNYSIAGCEWKEAPDEEQKPRCKTHADKPGHMPCAKCAAWFRITSKQVATEGVCKSCRAVARQEKKKGPDSDSEKGDENHNLKELMKSLLKFVGVMEGFVVAAKKSLNVSEDAPEAWPDLLTASGDS